MTDDFLAACPADELEDDKPRRFELDGVPVCLVRAQGDIYAINDVCSHADVSLSEGDVDETTIECWLHGSRFDLATGKPTGLPATQPVPVYPVKVDAGEIYVNIQTHIWSAEHTMSVLEIRDLHVSVDAEGGLREILRGVDLAVQSGQTHAIMGPNGSGKSTLAYSIAGHPKYHVTSGSVTLDGADVLAMSVDARARAGLFLAMQYPVEIPGVSVSNFLRSAATSLRGEAPKLREWVGQMNSAMKQLAIDPTFATRNVNEGFSGGEKKRHEILQLELLKPKMAILDETDSGLDVDALRVVSEGVNRVREGGDVGVLLITHYTRILRYITPDFVHVFAGGRIVEEGGPELAQELEESGYERFANVGSPTASGAGASS
jgi:Fe-S cluster assembly ATP-binding protein